MKHPTNFYDKSNTFWNCFRKSLTINKKENDGKQRILSIIANNFKYEDLQKQLSVCIKVVNFDFHNYVTDYSILGFKQFNIKSMYSLLS